MTNTRRVSEVAYGRDSYLLTSGTFGVMPLSLTGDMGVYEGYLLLSGDQLETNPDRTRRVLHG